MSSWAAKNFVLATACIKNRVMGKNEKIVKNCICRNHCGNTIVSKNRHDFIGCSCGTVAVDGRTDYLRRIFKTSADDFTELSEFEEKAKQ